MCKTIGTVGQQSEQTPVYGFSVKKVIIYSLQRGTTLIANEDPWYAHRYHTLVHDTTERSETKLSADFLKECQNTQKIRENVFFDQTTQNHVQITEETSLSSK